MRNEYLKENQIYWAANFEMSNNGRCNTDYPPMEVLYTGSDVKAIDDSAAAKRFNKLTGRNRRSIPLFETEEEATELYLVKLEYNFKPLKKKKEIIEERIKKTEEKQFKYMQRLKQLKNL